MSGNWGSVVVLTPYRMWTQEQSLEKARTVGCKHRVGSVMVNVRGTIPGEM